MTGSSATTCTASGSIRWELVSLTPARTSTGRETAVTSFAATVKGNSSSRPGTSTTPLVAVEDATNSVSAESSVLM